MAQANIKAVITAEDKASKVLKEFAGHTETAAKGINKNMLLTAAATVGATAAITKFGKDSFRAFEQQELATSRLKAGIKNVTSATDKNIDSLLEQASALQKITRFSDEAVVSAQGILSTFQLNQKAIEKLTPRLLDMSEGLARVDGTMPDLEGNAILVAKALGGEDVNGLTGALRRVGVVMTKTQTEMLNTGNMQQRLAIITQVLDQNFQGLAIAAGDTTAGKVAHLRNQFGELQEKVGELMASALNPLFDLMNKYPIIINIIVIALGTLATAFLAVKLAAGVSGALGAMQSLVTFVGGPIAAAGFGAIAAAAVGAGILIVRAANQAKSAWENAGNAAVSAGDSNIAAIKQLKQLVDTGTPAQKKRAKTLLDRFQNTGHFAHGTTFAPGGPAIVGERGPELINLPRGSQVIPNNQMGSINITIQAGAFMGSQLEARKFAKLILDAYKDLASSQNKTASQMLGG